MPLGLSPNSQSAARLVGARQGRAWRSSRTRGSSHPCPSWRKPTRPWAMLSYVTPCVQRYHHAHVFHCARTDTTTENDCAWTTQRTLAILRCALSLRLTPRVSNGLEHAHHAAFRVGQQVTHRLVHYQRQVRSGRRGLEGAFWKARSGRRVLEDVGWVFCEARPALGRGAW